MRRLAVVVAAALAGCGGGDDPGARDGVSAGLDGAPAARDGAPVGRHQGSTPARDAAPPSGDPVAHVRAIARIAEEHGGTRAAGTAGDKATEEYLVARLRAAGWRVTVERFGVPFAEVRGRPVVRAAGRRQRAEPLQFTGSGAVTGRLRAIGSPGCTASTYSGLRRGEIAIVPRGVCFFRDKARAAQRAGAAALLIRDERVFHGTLQRPAVRIPVFAVTDDVPSTGRAHIEVRAVSERRQTSNVIGELPGGPADRVVMAGGHRDSVVAGPGINDNASGVAAVLAAGERLANQPPPGARLRVGFWGAEEIGLVGSRRYVDALDADERRAVRAYLNLDMVGSPHPDRLVYDSDDAIERALRAHLPRARDTDLGDASDHAPFADAGIPVGGLFTGAGERQDPCYHRPCDDLGNVDRDALAKMTDALTAAVADLARRP
jgi:hypothetical protein